MEEFICNFLSLPKESLLWFYMLDQKYHLFDRGSIFDHYLETEQGMDDPYAIIYDNCLDPFWVEFAILTTIVKDIDENLNLIENVSTIEELIIVSDNGAHPLNCIYYNTNCFTEDTINKLSILIKELIELRKRYHESLNSFKLKNSSLTDSVTSNIISNYASKSRRR